MSGDGGDDEHFAPRYEVPRVFGEVVYKRCEPGKLIEGAGALGPGRWALHPRSTVPFVEIRVGSTAPRVFSWGEVYEIPRGHKGQVLNASYHRGDIILSAVAPGSSAPARPASITVPCAWTTDAVTNTSSELDTRLARRAYLVNPAAISPLPAGLPLNIHYAAELRGDFVPTGAVAAVPASGRLPYAYTVAGFGAMIALGIGAGENLDTAAVGRTLPDTRPMALLDHLYVTMLVVDAGPAGYGVTSPTFFVVEY